MGTLLTPRNLPGTGDFDPPDDDDPPECDACEGTGGVRCNCLTGSRCGDAGIVTCPDCNGTGYQPEPEYEPGIEVDE